MEYMVLNPVSSVFPCPPVQKTTIMQYDPILQTIRHYRVTVPARVYTDGETVGDFKIDKYLVRPDCTATPRKKSRPV